MDNKLDRYFREQLSKREHPFEEAYWEAAQALLKRRKRRRRLLFFWFFVGMGILATAWLLWPATQSPPTESATKSAIAQRTAPAAKAAEPTGKDGARTAENKALPATAGRSNENAHHYDKAAIRNVFPSVNEAPTAPQPPTHKSEVDPPSRPTATNEAPGQAENLTALPYPAPPMLPTAMQQRYVHQEKIAGKNRMLQDWSVEVSQVFTHNRQRNGYRLALRKDHWLKPGWYLFGSAAYAFRTGTFEANKVAVSRNYRFGLELDSQFLKPHSLHFLELNLGAGLSRNRHQVELSLSPRFLMGVRGERGFYRRIENTHPPEREFVPVAAGWLVEDGFRRFALSGTAAYWFRFDRRTAIGLSVRHQPGGVQQKGYTPPIGSYILKESGTWTFRLSAKLGF